ncbi:hypothetical protein AB0N59_01620 [Microbacterium sp. NPDC089321]|uniref:hypothetical protein n=1 Tax=Microbacterium sp. NPDC089321 TaxID=3155183 RepID=UPI00341A03B1
MSVTAGCAPASTPRTVDIYAESAPDEPSVSQIVSGRAGDSAHGSAVVYFPPPSDAKGALLEITEDGNDKPLCRVIIGGGVDTQGPCALVQWHYAKYGYLAGAHVRLDNLDAGTYELALTVTARTEDQGAWETVGLPTLHRVDVTIPEVSR